MKIAIIGSLKFAKEMVEMRKTLVSNGHSVSIPLSIEKYGIDVENTVKKNRKLYLEIASSYFKRNYDRISDCEGVVVANFEKNGIKNYIGGNTFAEIMFAFYGNKRIFLLNPMPTDEKLSLFTDELEAIKPKILNGNLNFVSD